MTRPTRPAFLAAVAALGLVAALAGPVAANTRERFTIDDLVEHEYSCGVVERTRIQGAGAASFAGDGTWLGTSIHFAYDGTFTDPATGRVVVESGRQTVTEADGLITMTGRGFFLRLAGEGVVLHDVGRLVFAEADGSTRFATPKVLRVDDPEVDSVTDAAVCGMFH